MLKRKPGIYWRICWCVIIPVALLVVFVYFIVTLEELTYEGRSYPTYIIRKSSLLRSKRQNFDKSEKKLLKFFTNLDVYLIFSVGMGNTWNRSHTTTNLVLGWGTQTAKYRRLETGTKKIIEKISNLLLLLFNSNIHHLYFQAVKSLFLHDNWGPRDSKKSKRWQEFKAETKQNKKLKDRSWIVEKLCILTGR